MTVRRSLTLAAIACTLASGPALAQVRSTAPTSSVFVSVNGAFQATSNDFRDGATFREHAENGRFDADYTVKGGPAFDVAGGVMVARRLAVGVGVTRFSRSTPATVTGSVPHPFFFSRPRTVSGTATGLTREELAIHLQARGVFSPSERLTVTVFGGPSFFRVTQGIVLSLNYDDPYPHDAVSFRDAGATESTERAMGVNAGGDVVRFFARQVGVGGTVQFSRASVELSAAGGSTLSLKAGGVQAGGGLRLRF